MKQSYPPESAQDIQRQQSMQSNQEAPVTGAAKEVAGTAKDHAVEVGSEVKQHAQNLAGQVKDRVSGEARSQSERLATGLRQLADDMGQMGNGTSSMASTVVQQISNGSRQAANYLEQHGPDGLLREAQEFARRKPGAFLLGAAIAGFVAGRLGKGLLSSSGSSTGMTGTSGMTGTAVTPVGETRPTATGVAPAPPTPPPGMTTPIPSTSAGVTAPASSRGARP